LIQYVSNNIIKELNQHFLKKYNIDNGESSRDLPLIKTLSMSKTFHNYFNSYIKTPSPKYDFFIAFILAVIISGSALLGLTFNIQHNNYSKISIPHDIINIALYSGFITIIINYFFDERPINFNALIEIIFNEFISSFNILISFLPLIISIFIIWLLQVLFKYLMKYFSIVQCLLTEFFFLILFCIVTVYFFPFNDFLMITDSDNYQLIIIIGIFLILSRFPFWLIEHIEGMGGYYFEYKGCNGVNKDSYNPNNFATYNTLFPSIQNIYKIKKVSEVNLDNGIKLAFELSNYCQKYFDSILLLRYFLQKNPYLVLSHIVNIPEYEFKKQIFQLTLHNQRKQIRMLFFAYIFLACAQIDAEHHDDIESPLIEIFGLFKLNLIAFCNVINEMPNNSFGNALKRIIFKLYPDYEFFYRNIGCEILDGKTDIEFLPSMFLKNAINSMMLAEELSGETHIPHNDIMISLYQSLYNALTLINFEEIVRYKYTTIPNINNFLFDKSLSDAMDILNTISDTIRTYIDASSQYMRQQALNQADNKIYMLNDTITEVHAPHDKVLKLVANHWQYLIKEEKHKIPYIHEPVSNPYILGNPVRGYQFVGREDIMTRLEELWGGAGQKPSVVLYGHRRMGKSSILHNLGARFGSQTTIVDFNTQREGMVNNTSELLYNLALAIYDALPDPMKQTLEGGEPDEESFFQHNPHTTFNRFLKRLDKVRAGTRFIITVDEFELLEKLIEEKKLDPSLLDFWRSLIQTFPWFIMAFAGLHTLRERTEDYWHPLYASVIAVPVSFLSPESAYRLITQPTPDFALDYDKEATDQIIALTSGQPYLTQLICHGLVTRFNRQTFEEGKERERRFSLDDVEAVINAPEFFRDGNAYFTGVWVQAEKSHPPEQIGVLKALSRSDQGMSLEELSEQTSYDIETIQQALTTLTAHDVVRETAEGWRFSVELMRRWVREKENDT
jgi:hypothetical protein